LEEAEASWAEEGQLRQVGGVGEPRHAELPRVVKTLSTSVTRHPSLAVGVRDGAIPTRYAPTVTKPTAVRVIQPSRADPLATRTETQPGDG
jgi:hypothetical protein